jgi:hypothetical protein
MSYGGQYFFKNASSTNTDINTIFDSQSPGTTETTEMYATNNGVTKDLYQIYTPLGTTSNLIYPTLTKFNIPSGLDLNASFALNFINTSTTTANTYYSYPITNGLALVIYASGTIYFNYTLIGNMPFYIIAGGGGGEEMLMAMRAVEEDQEVICQVLLTQLI